MSSLRIPLRRRAIPLCEKKAIIDASETKKTCELSAEFGLPTSTIRKILSIRHKVNAAVAQGQSANRAKLTGARNPQLDELMLNWLRETTESGTQLSGTVIKAKAMEYAQEMELKKFKASEGWLTNFKSRHWKFFKGISQGLDSDTPLKPAPSHYYFHRKSLYENDNESASVNDTLDEDEGWMHASSNDLLARLVGNGNVEDGSIEGDEEEESLYDIDAESVESEQTKQQNGETDGKTIDNGNEKPPKLIKEQSDLTSNSLSVPTSSVSLQDAYKSFCVFRQYAEENWSDPKVLEACHKLEGFLYKEKVKHRVLNGNN